MSTHKILITQQVHEALPNYLRRHDIAFEYRPDISEAELAGCIANFDGVVVRGGIPIDRNWIMRAPRLRLIARAGSGMDNIDVDYARQKGIACLNTPEGNRDSVAEHTMGLLLGLLHHIPAADRQVRAGKWDRAGNNGEELMGKTVGIIGFGNTGSALAKRLRGFGVSVLAYDKYKRNFVGEADAEIVRECPLKDIFQLADVVSLHIPLTPETRFMVGHRFIARFAKPFFLLNTSRGQIVDTQALYHAIREDKIRGAGLDVLEEESAQSSAGFKRLKQALLRMEQVVITPHVAGWSTASYRRIAKLLGKKIVETLKNQ